MGYNYSLKIIPELTSLPVKVIASLNYHGWIVLVLSAEHLQTSNKNCWSFPGLTKAFHVKNAPWECQAVAQVTFHSPQQLLKVVGKTMFVKWKIKGNMATLYFHSHVANHDGASYINGIKSYWELEAWNMTKTHGKTIAGFLGVFCCLLRAWIFFFFPLDPSCKATYESDIWDHSGQWKWTWNKFRKNYSSVQSYLMHPSRERPVFLIFFNSWCFKKTLSLWINDLSYWVEI